MPKPLITLTREQLEEVVISAGCLSDDSLNDLITVIGVMRLVRRSTDPGWKAGTPLHHVIIDDEENYVVGIKITNCPACIKDMVGEDVDEEDQKFSGS